MLECYDLHFPLGQACFGARTRGGVGWSAQVAPRMDIRIDTKTDVQ